MMQSRRSTVPSLACLLLWATNAAALVQKPSRRAFLRASSASVVAAVVGAQLAGARGDPSAIVFGDESLMAPKEHGTTHQRVQADLRYGVPNPLADRISSYTRHLAEPAGFFRDTTFEQTVLEANGAPVTFYDSVTGKALFRAPVGRSADEFLQESRVHGWPSFRDKEVVWDNVRVLRNSGETVMALIWDTICPIEKATDTASIWYRLPDNPSGLPSVT